MISAINSYGQNKVKVQKQNFGHVASDVADGIPQARMYLVRLQKGTEKFDMQNDPPVLLKAIQKAHDNCEFGAKKVLEHVAEFVGISLSKQ